MSSLVAAERAVTGAPILPIPAWQRRLPGLVLAMLASAMAILWIRVYQSSWEMVGDEAVIVMRSADVLSPASPLVGMPSAVDGWTSQADPAHPGPLGFWALAPFTTVLGTTVGAALLATWALAVGSIAVILRSATRQLGSIWAPVAVVPAMALLLVSFEAWRPLTPVMTMLPALAMCFTCWAVVGSHGRSWPLLAAFSSFTLQSDLSFLPITASLLLLAVAVTLLRWRQTRHSGGAPLTSKQLTATVCVVAIAWALPILESVGNRGNYYQMLQVAFAGIPTVGPAKAAAASRELLATVAALATLSALRWRVIGPVVRSLAVTAGFAAAGAFIATAATPASAGTGDIYYRLPTIVATAFVGFATCVVLVVTLPRWIAPRAALGVLSAVALVFVPVGLLDWSRTTPVDTGWLSHAFPSIPDLTDQLERLDGDTYELRPLGGPEAIGMALGLGLSLERVGYNVNFVSGLAPYVGLQRLRTGQEDGQLYLTFHADPPAATAQLVAQWAPASPEHSTRMNTSETDEPPDRPTADSLLEGARLGSGILDGERIGSIIAGSGLDRDLVVGLDEKGILETGQELISNPARLRSLSDTAAMDLARSGLLEFPDDGRGQALLDQTLSTVSVVSIWLVEDGQA